MMENLAGAFEDWPCAAVMEREGLVVARNAMARRLLGGEPDEAVRVGSVLPGAEFRLRGEERLRFDCMLVRRYGRAMGVHVAAQPTIFEGRACRLLLLMEREELSEDSEPAGLTAKDVLDALPEGAAITNGDAVVHVNPEFSRLFGFSAEECVGREMSDLVVPVGRQHERELALHMVRSTGRFEMETMRRNRAGAELDVTVRGVAVRLGGETFGTLTTYRDIRGEKEKQARLAYTARHDVLTGLPNRAQFLERVEMMLGRLRRRPDRRFAVIFLDLDGFKKVNDTLGHAAGDELLVQVAERLTECLRPQDAVARFGGDEFALLLDESEGLESVAGRIQQAIQRPVDLGVGGVGQVAASLGIVIAGAEHGNAESILAEADRAMYEAKSAGRAGYVLRC